MDIVIHNYLSGSFLLEQRPNFWDVIVILDSGLEHTEFVAEHARSHFYLQFDDVGSPTRGKRSPTADDLQSALEFSKKSDNLVVCCRAGQSRSAATAFAICFQRLGPDAAYRMLNPTRHVPNELIINIAAQLIGEPLLLATFEKWRKDHQHIKLWDFVDEIERELERLESQGARNRIVGV
jgi:predicted protein tyrosine phosphatase